MKKFIFAALLFSSCHGFAHGDEKAKPTPIPALSNQRVIQQFAELFKEGDASILQGYFSNSFTLFLQVNENGVLELDYVESQNPKLINYATEAFKKSKISLDSTFVGEKLVYKFKID